MLRNDCMRAVATVTLSLIVLAWAAPDGFCTMATEEEARRVSENWMSYMVDQTGGWSGDYAPKIASVERIVVSDTLLGWHISIHPKGYITVPVLKEMPPVKAYSDEYSMDINDPEGFPRLLREVLQSRARLFASRYGSLDSSQPLTGKTLFGNRHLAQWDGLLAAEGQFKSDLVVGKVDSLDQVGPLLTTVWHQDDPYNARCPIGNGGKCPVGCVATAAVQVMKFWDFPPEGYGGFCYYWNGDDPVGGGDLCVNFYDDYDWANMPNSCSGGCSSLERAALAELSYEVAVAYEMDFGVGGSGAWPTRSTYIFPTFFGYKNTVDMEYRSSYSAQTWFELIQGELNEGRPMMYGITGHEIVCDGWRYAYSQNQYHVNYGWGGSNTGWYAIDDIPGSDNPLTESIVRRIEPAPLPAAVQYDTLGLAVVTGNNDVVLDPDETHDLSITLHNSGVAVTNVAGTLSSAHPDVSVISGSASYGDLPQDGTAASSSPYQIYLDSGTTDDAVKLYLDITGDSYSSSDTLFVGVSDSIGFFTWDHYNVSTGYRDQWHVSDSRNHTAAGSASWKCGGVGTGDYKGVVDAVLVSELFVVQPGDAISFWHWIEAESGGSSAYDGGLLEISIDGGAWEVLSPGGFGAYTHTIYGGDSNPLPAGTPCYSGTYGWRYISIDLSSYVGLVRVRFRFVSDCSTTREGWYIDDVITPLPLIWEPKWVDETHGPLGNSNSTMGVAWGDYDDDGDSDLYVANSNSDNKLYRNDAGTFVDATVAPLDYSGSSRGAAWGDYDNDGDLDLYVANVDSNRLFRNDGGGVFTDVTSPVLGYDSECHSVAWADYDNDGDLDLYIAGYGVSNKLLRNDGGSFADVTAGPLGDAGNSTGVAWGDYDNDGDPDLYVGSEGSNILIRNDHGSFVQVYGVHEDAGTARGVAWGDCDNDGHLDMYVVNSGSSNKLFVNSGPPSWSFTDGTSTPLDDSGDGTGMAWGDYDNDGDMDLYVANFGENKLFRNDSGLSFADVTTSPASDTSDAYVVAWSDYDNDGDLDLYLGNDGSSNKLLMNNHLNLNHWLQVKLAGSYSNSWGIGARVRAVAGGISQSREISGGSGYNSQNSLIAEFGLGSAIVVDSLIVSWPTGTVQVLENVAVDTLLEVTEPPPALLDITYSPLSDDLNGYGVAWGDYDGDGDLDIYLANTNGDTNKLFRNDNGVFTDAVNDTVGNTGNSTGTAWADYDNDGDLDLYVVVDGGSNRLYRNEGAGTFSDATTGPLADAGSGEGVAWADYDSDGYVDLYVANDGGGGKLLRNAGGGVFTNVTSGPLGGSGDAAGVAWADYDNDADLDLYLAGSGALLRNDGSGVFVDATAGPMIGIGDSRAGAWGDYDNDGLLDLYVTIDGATNKLFRNEGAGVFSDATSGSLAVSGDGRSVGWADYDNDGDLDLYVANMSQPNRLLRNDGGVFVDATTVQLAYAGDGNGMGWGDYNGDGSLDLYLGNLNSSNKLFTNMASPENHWLHVNLIGDQSNRCGIGARVRTVVGGLSQIREVEGGSGHCSQNSLTAEFGIASATTVDSLIIEWPSGIRQIMSQVPVDTLIDVLEAAPEWIAMSGSPLGNTGTGRGVAWGDYDGDGDDDIYVVNQGQANKLLRNDGNGDFVDVTSAPMDDAGDGRTGVWGDYDNDGDLDLYLVNNGDNLLFRNDGAAVFVDVTAAPLDHDGNGQGAAWGDYDNDGDIDLYLAVNSDDNVLMRNDGGGTFADATHGPLGDANKGRGVAWGDYDNDGDLDIYLSNYGQANKLFRNDSGTFVDATTGPLGSTGYGQGVAWGDYDNDGDLDLYLVDKIGANSLFRNDGGGSFSDVTAAPLDNAEAGRGVAWADYDNDGDLDLYLANEAVGNRLFSNDGDGSFSDVTAPPLGDEGRGYGVAWGDHDNDGDLDIYLVNSDDPNRLFRNDLNNGNHWLSVKLVGTTANASGIGARIVVVAGGVSQVREVSAGSGFYSQNSLSAEFGLGAETIVDTVKVLWPSGSIDYRVSVASNNVLVIVEGATPISSISSLPGSYGLHENFPNPFNPKTVIAYDLPKASNVDFHVFNVIGRKVRILAQGEYTEAGRHTMEWDGTDDRGNKVASGIYFYRLKAGDFVETRRMVLLK